MLDFIIPAVFAVFIFLMVFKFIDKRDDSIPLKLKIPLKEKSQILNLSICDTFSIYLYGFLPFLGWLFIPNWMKKLNLTDYYELRYNAYLAKITNEPESNLAKRLRKESLFHSWGFNLLLLKKRHFNFIRARLAKLVCLISLALYLEEITHFLEYLRYLGLAPFKSTLHPSSFADIIFYVKSQLAMPFFSSIFIQSSWLLLLGGIFYYPWRFWREMGEKM